MPSLLILAALLAAAPPAQAAQPPQDRSAPPQLIGSRDLARPADYPREALRQNRQGQVRFELDVDERGRVRGCTVQRSSGHALLDRAACDVYRTRARYTPARDAAGTATSAKDQRSVAWRIGTNGPEALDIDPPDLIHGVGLIRSEDYPASALSRNEQGAVTALVHVDARGAIQSCTVEQSSGSASLDARTCELLTARGRFEPARDEHGTAIAGEFRQRIEWRLGAADAGPRLLNLQEVVTSDDYPAISVDKEQEGRVTVRLHIDEQGLVSSCRIEKSSGHPPLDEQTCALYRARARFEPVRDRRGRAVASDFTQNVTWKLEGEPGVPSPRHAWTVRITVAMDKQGRMLDCKVEAIGLPPSPHECESVVPFDKPAAGEGSGIAGFTIAETYFYPVEPDKLGVVPELKDATNVARQVSRIVIEPDGRVSDCTGMRYSGSATPEADACRVLEFRFLPAPPGAGPLVGTVVTTLYVRAHSVT